MNWWSRRSAARWLTSRPGGRSEGDRFDVLQHNSKTPQSLHSAGVGCAALGLGSGVDVVLGPGVAWGQSGGHRRSIASVHEVWREPIPTVGTDIPPSARPGRSRNTRPPGRVIRRSGSRGTGTTTPGPGNAYRVPGTWRVPLRGTDLDHRLLGRKVTTVGIASPGSGHRTRFAYARMARLTRQSRRRRGVESGALHFRVPGHYARGRWPDRLEAGVPDEAPAGLDLDPGRRAQQPEGWVYQDGYWLKERTPCRAREAASGGPTSPGWSSATPNRLGGPITDAEALLQAWAAERSYAPVKPINPDDIRLTPPPGFQPGVASGPSSALGRMSPGSASREGRPDNNGNTKSLPQQLETPPAALRRQSGGRPKPQLRQPVLNAPGGRRFATVPDPVGQPGLLRRQYGAGLDVPVVRAPAVGIAQPVGLRRQLGPGNQLSVVDTLAVGEPGFIVLHRQQFARHELRVVLTTPSTASAITGTAQRAGQRRGRSAVSGLERVTPRSTHRVGRADVQCPMINPQGNFGDEHWKSVPPRFSGGWSTTKIATVVRRLSGNGISCENE